MSLWDMPYRRSKARKRFDLEAEDLLVGIRHAHSPACTSSPVRKLALCSAVLLCSAKLESYIQELLDDWATAVSRSTITTEKLPRSVRAYLLNHSAIIDAYRKFFVDQDESALLRRIGGLMDQTHFDVAVDGRGIPAFPARRMYEGRKYPSPENLQRLFNRFSIERLFDELDREARRDTKAMLVSFNDLRTEMAHTGMPVGLNEADVKQRVSDIVAIVRYIDRVFYRYAKTYLGDNEWIT